MEDETTAGKLRARIRKHAMAKRLRRLVHPAWMGTLRRTQPLSPSFGSDRGQPVDRYYIETFLEEHRGDIRGRVLEIKDSSYTVRFGSGVTESEVLDVDPANRQATIIADLQRAGSIQTADFDCFILTQVLGLIADLRSAIAESYRILRPGGVLLVTLPGLASRAADRTEAPADYWRFTADALDFLLKQQFGTASITLRSYGNVLSAVAMLMGMAREELSTRELNAVDARFPVVVAGRAIKA
jgi:SAM-dependent methyltransferase